MNKMNKTWVKKKKISSIDFVAGESNSSGNGNENMNQE